MMKVKRGIEMHDLFIDDQKLNKVLERREPERNSWYSLIHLLIKSRGFRWEYFI